MKLLRILAVIGALLLMAGEAWRSWGVGRPAAFWLDDMLAGALLIGAALALARPTAARRRLFTGAWGVMVGMLYGSFFSKIFDPGATNFGNVAPDVLTALVGFAFVVSIIGFVASVRLPDEIRP